MKTKRLLVSHPCLYAKKKTREKKIVIVTLSLSIVIL